MWLSVDGGGSNWSDSRPRGWIINASAISTSLSVPPNKQMSIEVVDVYLTTTPSEPSVVLWTMSPGVTSPNAAAATVSVLLPPTSSLAALAATEI